MIHNNLEIVNLWYVDACGLEREEKWVDVFGYEGLYEVSNLGRVKSLPKKLVTFRHQRFRGQKLLCTTTFHPSGYRFVTLIKDKIRKSYAVHRLVGIHFLDNPNNLPQINHEDADKTNNKYFNLSWCTNEENIEHAIKSGLMGWIKLSKKDVVKIRELAINGADKFIISKEYNISLSHANSIIKKYCWKSV